MAEQDGRAGQDAGGGARGGRWRGPEGVYGKAFAWPRTTLIFAARHRPGEAYVRVAGGWPHAARPLWRARSGGAGRRASRRGVVQARRWWTILNTARAPPAGGRGVPVAGGWRARAADLCHASQWWRCRPAGKASAAPNQCRSLWCKRPAGPRSRADVRTCGRAAGREQKMNVPCPRQKAI